MADRMEFEASEPGDGAGATGRRGGESLSTMQGLILAVLGLYKYWVSPWLPGACRFHPTCSEYMMEAVKRYGAGRGVWMGLRRLSRCHPLNSGGLDPVV
jgi:putative membrane protein insertion efficiency factor